MLFNRKGIFFQIWGNLGLIYYRLAMAYEKLDQAEKSSEMLTESLRVLKITHGKNHRLVNEVQRKLSPESEF